MAHVIGKAVGFFLVGLDPAADIGVESDQVINGRMLGVSFECVGHNPKLGRPPLLRLWRLRHNTGDEGLSPPARTD
jgi:hypothetical protein